MITYYIICWVVVAYTWGYISGAIAHRPTVTDAAEIMAKESHRIKEILKPQRRYIPRG